jgi:hypothetical protein
MPRRLALANPLPYSSKSMTSKRFIATQWLSLGTIGDFFDFVSLNVPFHQPRVGPVFLTPNIQNVTAAFLIYDVAGHRIGSAVVVKRAGFLPRKHRGRQ